MGLMRPSLPMAAATSRALAPTCSQRFAISLIKVIFVARKALEAYLIISAVSGVVTTTGLLERENTL